MIKRGAKCIAFLQSSVLARIPLLSQKDKKRRGRFIAKSDNLTAIFVYF
jgi:hypothetical protein